VTDFDGVAGIASPAKRALASAGVTTVADLARFTEAQVKSWHGIGPRVMVALNALMVAQAIRFRERNEEERGTEHG